MAEKIKYEVRDVFRNNPPVPGEEPLRTEFKMGDGRKTGETQNKDANSNPIDSKIFFKKLADYLAEETGKPVEVFGRVAKDEYNATITSTSLKKTKDGLDKASVTPPTVPSLPAIETLPDNALEPVTQVPTQPVPEPTTAPTPATQSTATPPATPTTPPAATTQPTVPSAVTSQATTTQKTEPTPTPTTPPSVEATTQTPKSPPTMAEVQAKRGNVQDWAEAVKKLLHSNIQYTGDVPTNSSPNGLNNKSQTKQASVNFP